jgi:TolB-like protein/tetratricopeptide (TPR) repeat protein/tRNA A-37 threonylcarbamoyl transferase component Bud32
MTPAMLANRYTIGREIGRGGMASVFLAEDHKHERQVAIKFLLPELSAAIGAERFTREIKLVARLQHPHILPLYDSGEADGTLFFVMPYVEGESLRERLTRAGPLRLDETARIVRQIADALDYAHGRDVVHRDLKPENILLAGGQALLADFGVARAAALPGSNETLTSVGMTLGTPAYMSPEQAAGERTLDARSDVYALGCVCYEMLSGAPPFTGANAVAVISQHIVAAPPPLVAAHEPLPAGVGAAVDRALAKSPDDRFASTGAFAVELEAAAMAQRAPNASDERLRAIQRQNDNRKTVLVLDFTNISGTPDVDWLATGIAETVSVDLKKVGEIRIVGVDPATRHRLAADKAVLDSERAIAAGRTAGARWVVWGGFQKAGPRIRLTPQFADTESGAVIRAEKIDGAMDDIFELQDRIVTGLIDVLRIRLTSDEVAEIERPQTKDLSAYEYYAKGQRAFYFFGKESAKQAGEYYRKAIELDPSYALAHAGLGSLLMPLYIASGDQKHLDAGVAALQRAMELDPRYGEPYVFLAYMYLRQHRFDDSQRAARSAIDREPGSYMGWYLYGISIAARAVETGDVAPLPRAIPPLLRARALAPAWHPTHMVAGAMYLLRGQYGHAAIVLDEAVQLEAAAPALVFLGAYVQRALLHINLGEHAAAGELLRRALATYPNVDHVYAEAMTAYAHFADGCLGEREDRQDDALAAFTAACTTAADYPHRLSIGAHWVKARCGMARVLYRRGDADAAARALNEARELFETKHRFVWGWFMGAAEADMLYELASAHAAMARDAEAIDYLRRAIEYCWSDLPQFAHDPAFDALRDRDDVRRLVADAASAVTLPPPAGAGGMPDLA